MVEGHTEVLDRLLVGLPLDANLGWWERHGVMRGAVYGDGRRV